MIHSVQLLGCHVISLTVLKNKHCLNLYILFAVTGMAVIPLQSIQDYLLYNLPFESAYFSDSHLFSSGVS